jgi:hypothetical protein
MAIEPYRTLVLGRKGEGFQWVMRVIEPATFLMKRRMLIGLTRRAETLTVADQSRRAA